MKITSIKAEYTSDGVNYAIASGLEGPGLYREFVEGEWVLVIGDAVDPEAIMAYVDEHEEEMRILMAETKAEFSR